MTERFEAAAPLATRIGVELATATGTILALFAVVLAGLGPWSMAAVLTVAVANAALVRWLMLGVRYEVSPHGLVVRQGPLRSTRRWSALAALSHGVDPLLGCAGLIVRWSDGECSCLRPRDLEAFVAAVRRHVPDLALAEAATAPPHETSEAA